MKCNREDASHFLIHEKAADGLSELLDCIPLYLDTDGHLVVVVFDEGSDCASVYRVEAKRVLSVTEVCEEIIERVINDAVLLGSDEEETCH